MSYTSCVSVEARAAVPAKRQELRLRELRLSENGEPKRAELGREVRDLRAGDWRRCGESAREQRA